jgi:DNA-binding LytR/AlgR family response regulator
MLKFLLLKPNRQCGGFMETLRIAICEDAPEDAERLRLMIAESEVPSIVRIYSSGEALLQAFAPGFFDLILLDIYLDGLKAATGMDVAREIRASDENVRLAFTTASREHAMAGYGVNASQYLLKPLQSQDVTALLHSVERYWSDFDDTLTVVIDRQKHTVQTRDILYVEVYNKRCTIHTISEDVTSCTSIDELEKRLPAPPFLRCHRSFIVNMDHVRAIDRDFTVSNGDTVYIRRPDQWKMKKAYRNYVVSLARESA